MGIPVSSWSTLFPREFIDICQNEQRQKLFNKEKLPALWAQLSACFFLEIEASSERNSKIFSLGIHEMKFSTMILLAPLKVRLKTKRSPFTVCEYLVKIQSYEGLKLLKL